MNRYRKGYYAERKLIKEMYDRGAVYCTRSAGSHTPIDVIAVFKNEILAFQVKNSKKNTLTKKELKELKYIKYKSPDNFSVFVAYYRGGKFEFEEVF